MDPRFLEGLQKYHEDWLFYRNSTFQPPAKVVFVNATLSLEDFTKEVKALKHVIIPRNVLEES
jgi:hypothetical protein